MGIFLHKTLSKESKTESKIISLGKYLIGKDVSTPLKLQKLLFFFRVEEIKTKKESGYFKKDKNFQAWIYGPVNEESYNYFKYYFWGKDEKDKLFLDEKEFKEIDEKFSKVFSKYNKMSDKDLVKESHKNREWKKARKGLEKNVPCTKFLSEKTPEFIIFK